MSVERAWREALDALEARNGLVELWPLAEEGATPVGLVYRSRLLDRLPDGGLVVERPAVAGVATRMASGLLVDVVVLHKTQRWRGRCSVLELFQHRLNAQMEIPAFRLSTPLEISSGQRRHFFRVDVRSGDFERWRLEVKPIDHDPASADELPALDAAACNLSGGGMGVRVPVNADTARLMKSAASYRLVLKLPGLEEPLQLDARAVHIEKLSSESIYLGLEFQFEDEFSQRRVQDELARFATRLQRRQLQLARGA